MKKIFLFIALLFTSFFSMLTVFAEGSGTISTQVSANIVGFGCKCIDTVNNCNSKETEKYSCEVPSGFTGFAFVFRQIIRYVIQVALILGVLAVVGLGIAWSFAGGDDVKAKSKLKNWAIMLVIGLAILFFFSQILQILAPWIYD